ncbi:MAG: hypothetical protein GEV07_08210 [Streptosporangiales bacterium]|nr:hypothetical protein [Streptosporangiales bacterium]
MTTTTAGDTPVATDSAPATTDPAARARKLRPHTDSDTPIATHTTDPATLARKLRRRTVTDSVPAAADATALARELRAADGGLRMRTEAR